MPRTFRFLPPNHFYHIMNRGNNQLPIFRHDDDYRFYLSKLIKLKRDHPFDLYHYCLMETHLHLLLRTIKDTDFSTFSKRLNLIYSSYYQRSYGYSGQFWQGRFRSILIDADPYLIQCGKYIELNPVRAGIVSKPQDYPWSSYRYYAKGIKDTLITRDIFYQQLGKNEAERRQEYIDLAIGDLEKDNLEKTNIKALGDRSFIYKINRKMKYHQNNKNASYRQR